MNQHGRRLLSLGNYLETLKEELLTINWDIPTIPGKGIAGCPLGYATVIFKREGFKYLPGMEGTPIVRWKGLSGMNAVQAFFGITLEEAWDAFTPSGYSEITKRMIVTRLKVLGRKHS